jgi:hypothetical protein
MAHQATMTMVIVTNTVSTRFDDRGVSGAYVKFSLKSDSYQGTARGAAGNRKRLGR